MESSKIKQLLMNEVRIKVVYFPGPAWPCILEGKSTGFVTLQAWTGIPGLSTPYKLCDPGQVA